MGMLMMLLMTMLLLLVMLLMMYASLCTGEGPTPVIQPPDDPGQLYTLCDFDFFYDIYNLITSFYLHFSPPESCIFSQFVNIGVLFVTATIYIRYKQVVHSLEKVKHVSHFED